jgi:hypothetical protein
MDTIWRGVCLILLIVTSVSLSSPGQSQNSAYGVFEECNCRLGCVAGLGAEHGLEPEDCSAPVSTRVRFVEPGTRTFVPGVHKTMPNTTLSEKILQYFQEMLSTEFALTIISPPDARSQ